MITKEEPIKEHRPTRYLFDIEANELLYKVSKIWCIVVQDVDTNETWAYHGNGIRHGIEKLQEASCLIGHNIIGYDLPAIWKLYSEWKEVPLIIDTLVISRAMYPERYGGHSLAAWGERLGHPKLEFSDFTYYTPEMLTYCKQDVLLNTLVLKELEIEVGHTLSGYKIY